MQNIGPFINLGWHTVPLKGELVRRPDGSKTEPMFEKAWRKRYQDEKNEVHSKLGGTMTGRVSGIIAIDCDNDDTYALFKSLDPEYTFIFKSLGKLDKDGKEKDCGTIVYEYTEDFMDSFSINDGTLALDVYSNGGFVYLPTDANKTKVPWSGVLPKLKPLPTTTLILLNQLKRATGAQKGAEAVLKQNVLTANCLAPLVSQFVDHRKFLPGLFKIITPRDFRDEPQYATQGFLHPENVPEGRGSEYLSKISAILGADISISEELYVSAMHDINELWPTPMDADRLDNTIVNPMITGHASIDGNIIWQYDENWSSHRLILHTKRQSNIELGFDDRRNMYYAADVANEHLTAFHRDSELMAYVSAVAISVPKKQELTSSIPIINVSSVPSKPFGFFAADDPTARTLNTFIRTPELAILEEPESYAKFYKRPATTLKFFETLIPEDHMREYLMSFLKRKLTTFEYSPVMLYFLGVQGSGKDTFVTLVEKILGKVAKPTVKEWLEMFNGWLLDSYFVQLDEYGDQLSFKDRDEAWGKLKAYTGKRNVQIRQMRTDGFSYLHNATFISTANRNPFGLEDGDRRIALFSTPNVLREADWVDDVTVVYNQILDESKDFCYWLATEVTALSGPDYNKPPESANKHSLIADSMHAAQRIAYAMKHGMLDYLKDLGVMYSCKRIGAAITNKKIYAEDVEELYDQMTEFKGEMRAVNKAVRAFGINLKDSSLGGQKAFYYDLDYFKGGPFDAKDV
jgi:hypothetical protein